MDILVVVDMQNDFVYGSMKIPGARKLIEGINEEIYNNDLTIFTQDWHRVDHPSFIKQGGNWPPHCIQDTWGARIVDGLVRPKLTYMVFKGQMIEQYSGYEENECLTPLEDTISICGVATEYCVKYTALDYLKAGYRVRILKNLIKGVDSGNAGDALALLEHNGGVLT